jgi:hypothetical protein
MLRGLQNDRVPLDSAAVSNWQAALAGRGEAVMADQGLFKSLRWR